MLVKAGVCNSQHDGSELIARAGGAQPVDAGKPAIIPGQSAGCENFWNRDQSSPQERECALLPKTLRNDDAIIQPHRFCPAGRTRPVRFLRVDSPGVKV